MVWALRSTIFQWYCWYCESKFIKIEVIRKFDRIKRIFRPSTWSSNSWWWLKPNINFSAGTNWIKIRVRIVIKCRGCPSSSARCQIIAQEETEVYVWLLLPKEYERLISWGGDQIGQLARTKYEITQIDESMWT